MFDAKGRFIIENYTVKSTFSSFLPGIAGEFGIPAWCFYVNRGQVITSFGLRDKENSIMEFYPAHQAYQNTAVTGFRTFLKIDGKFYEPFYNFQTEKKMYIGMNEVEIEETNTELGIRVNVKYFTLPNEDVGGLVRFVTIANLTNNAKTIEMLDGMPAVITYGTEQYIMKVMAQTTKAWMQVEDVEKSMPFYRVRASTADSAVVKPVNEGNFYVTMDASGNLLPVIVDPEVVFGYNTALTDPIGFLQMDVLDLLKEKQVAQNSVPTGFFGKKFELVGNEEVTHYGVIGQTANKDLFHAYIKRCAGASYFEKKYEEACLLVENLCEGIKTQSADHVFDAYCAQTYLDNLLRGGFPIILGKDSVYYMYSRKHGDIERDYNFFSMLPEFFSQGNANFRDVNQNRRCDPLFSPYVRDMNVKKFYNLIQLDGYNPLAVEMESFTITPEGIDAVLLLIGEKDKAAVSELLLKPYTPGSLTGFLHNNSIEVTASLREILDTAIDHSTKDQNARFGEGYWTDHWTYNLDLIESYLAVFPDDEQRLLFDDNSFTYFESKAVVNPRSKRYQLTENGVRQYNAIDKHIKENVTHLKVKTQYGKGAVYETTLASKLMVLAAVKFAALDPYGMGIEMEGGKPGWYDALNGMPGIFGSSVAETYELSRMIDYMIDIFTKYQREVAIPKEAAHLTACINESLGRLNSDNLSLHDYWNEVNNYKEAYWEEIAFGVGGQENTLSASQVLETLNAWQSILYKGIARALKHADGLSPCYFSYEMDKYENVDGKIIAKSFKPVVMPAFLEGPVRYFKLKNQPVSQKEMHQRVKESGLYDKKLKMYKVNAPLSEMSHEIGRAKAFTPGWLENESIWLHMEYKYILELLRSGMYNEFFTEFKNTCIPFLDAEVYGRSLLENSSFIASSANPNPRIHGKGFVARLSGSTAEFVNIWQIMMFGLNPFIMIDSDLAFTPQPILPKYLVGDDGQLTCRLLGKTTVVYMADNKKDIIPGEYQIQKITLHMDDGNAVTVDGAAVIGANAYAIRDGQVSRIEVLL